MSTKIRVHFHETDLGTGSCLLFVTCLENCTGIAIQTSGYCYFIFLYYITLSGIMQTNLLTGKQVMWALADEICSLADAHPCRKASFPAVSQRGLVVLQTSSTAAGCISPECSVSTGEAQTADKDSLRHSPLAQREFSKKIQISDFSPNRESSVLSLRHLIMSLFLGIIWHGEACLHFPQEIKLFLSF